MNRCVKTISMTAILAIISSASAEEVKDEGAKTIDKTINLIPKGSNVGVYGGQHKVPWAEMPGGDQSQTHYSGGIVIRF